MQLFDPLAGRRVAQCDNPANTQAHSLAFLAEGAPGLVLQSGAPQAQLLELPLEALSGGDELRRAGPDLAQGTELALMGEIERRGRVVQLPGRPGRLRPGVAELREPAHQAHQPSRPGAGTADSPSGAGSLPLWVAGHLDRKARLDFVYEVIGELTEMRQRKALLLSGGQQKLVALGRALAIGTKCLLLDEPFEGIAPALSERLSEVLASLKGKDLTLLMSQSDLNHSRGLIDVEFTIERGANPVTAGQ